MSRIKALYEPFQNWQSRGNIWIVSDTHFEDADCYLMDPDWLFPMVHVNCINSGVKKLDTLIHLGDVGNPEWMNKIKCGRKILITGNHDAGVSKYTPYFDEVYDGPILLSPRILLSHEPIEGLPWCINIHGHNHAGQMYEKGGINLAANVAKYVPFCLNDWANNGGLKEVPNIHRLTIDKASEA